MKTNRFAVFGGTFDPPHRGHLSALLDAARRLDCVRIYVVVANEPWLKAARNVVPKAPAISAPAHRLAMTKALCEHSLAEPLAPIESAAEPAPEPAVEPIAELVVNSVELERGGPSYTIDTVVELSRRFQAHPAALAETAPDVPAPPAKPLLVVGSDLVREIDQWHRADELRELVELDVIDRSAVNVSSSEIRSLIAGGRAAQQLVPAMLSQEVADYIEAHQLYSRTG